VYSDRKITRLGIGVDRDGRLSEAGMESSLAALKEFSGVISRYGVEDVRAVGTSALREADNSGLFLARALEDTGIRIEIITGDEEAALTLKGVLLSFGEEINAPLAPGRRHQGVLFEDGVSGVHPIARGETCANLVLDMGGGSTEWIFVRKGFPPLMGSIPIGVIKLSGRFLRSDPPGQDEVDELEVEILPVLENLYMKIGRYFANDTILIGTAGTFTTLAAMDMELERYASEKIHMHRIPFERLMNICERLIALPLDERKKVKGLEPERADLIIPGIIFTISVMKYFRFREITISDYGLLEGALLDIEETSEKSISKA